MRRISVIVDSRRAVAGVEWVVLTNGDEYRIYNAHAAVAVDEKLFRGFKLSAEDGVAEQTLPLLGRDRMEENQLQVLWKAEFVDRQVKAALDELFEAGDDTALVKLLRRKIPGLSPAEVRASLRRAQVDVSFPVASEPAPTPAAAPPKLRLANRVGPEAGLRRRLPRRPDPRGPHPAAARPPADLPRCRGPGAGRGRRQRVRRR